MKIFEIENRKGNFNTQFYGDKFLRISKELKSQRKKIKRIKAIEGDLLNHGVLESLLEEKKELELEKKRHLNEVLQNYSDTVCKKNFKFNFSKFFHEKSGKLVYSINRDAPSYFAMKQLQFNISRTFKVKQGNRYLISKQVQSLLKDNFPKAVLRTDIKSFYESVPQHKLLSLVMDNQLLSPHSKKLIESLFYSYNELTEQLDCPVDERKGIPRGAGISAYLAELFMRELDNDIRGLNEVQYYARFVDDIIIIFAHPVKDKETYEKKVRDIVAIQSLKLNDNKTEVYNLSDNKEHDIHLLGYIFKIRDCKYLETSISKNKKDKYILRVNTALHVYLQQRNFAPNEAFKLLIHRINYLTKNTRLHKPKKGLVGIFYSNSLLEDNLKDLEELDNKLQEIVDDKIPPAVYGSLNKKIKSFSFKSGYLNKSFFNINSTHKKISDLRSPRLKEIKKLQNNFETIISIWKNEKIKTKKANTLSNRTSCTQ